jgi:hypothetical protein
MDTTLIILSLVILLYLGACFRQWKQLARADKMAEGVGHSSRRDR